MVKTSWQTSHWTPLCLPSALAVAMSSWQSPQAPGERVARILLHEFGQGIVAVKPRLPERLGNQEMPGQDPSGEQEDQQQG